MRRILCSLTILIVTAAIAPVASGQTNARSASTKPAPKEMPPIIVKGTPPAPQAIYVLEKSRTTAQALELKKSFVPRIVGSVDRALF